MEDAVTIVLNFITALLHLIPDSPFMYLIALAIVLTLLNYIYSLFLN